MATWAVLKHLSLTKVPKHWFLRHTFDSHCAWSFMFSFCMESYLPWSSKCRNSAPGGDICMFLWIRILKLTVSPRGPAVLCGCPAPLSWHWMRMFIWLLTHGGSLQNTAHPPPSPPCDHLCLKVGTRKPRFSFLDVSWKHSEWAGVKNFWCVSHVCEWLQSMKTDFVGTNKS